VVQSPLNPLECVDNKKRTVNLEIKNCTQKELKKNTKPDSVFIFLVLIKTKPL
jgi:hypothetical protein